MVDPEQEMFDLGGMLTYIKVDHASRSLKRDALVACIGVVIVKW